MAGRPELTGVLETALYVDDVARAVSFYRNLFEFDVLFENERGAAASHPFVISGFCAPRQRHS